MGHIGAFRDDYYNAIGVLPQTDYNATTQNGGVIAGTLLAGGGDVYVNFSGQTTAQALTTDTAANIVASLQTAVAAYYKQQLAGLSAGVNVPPPGVPNLFNLTYTLTIINNNTASGAITLTGGTGVTITGTNTVAVGASRIYVVTVTSPTSVVLQNVASGTV